MLTVPKLILRAATEHRLPAGVDSNSPCHWRGDRFVIFMSAGHPFRSEGKSPYDLGEAQPVTFDNTLNGGRWIECTVLAADGTLYGWYHHEPAGLCPGTSLTAPKIGAIRSTDDGRTWQDLGFVLTAPEGTLRCDAQNGYFAGGHGDFCVMLDPAQRYLYFFFGNYAGKPEEQGVAVARMDWAHRDKPVGKVYKWFQGGWQEPGLGGRVTPIFPAMSDWMRADCDAFWGPSVHRNTHLKQYVMLLNRAKGTGWVQEGIYVSFSTRLDEPRSWSQPQKILVGGRWYPQVIGDPAERGTDKLAGKTARLYLSGISEYEAVFDG
ncbi:MAG: DUF4185 domain-containing protein [Firmicutes bacterium]|nr:DUF4185 domain-containing protein [Bacillota bacterium]